MIFKESQLFCEGKITALPHNFQPNTWVRGGICLVHLRPFVSKTPQIFRSILHYCCFLLNNSPMQCCLPVLPRRGQVAETPVHAPSLLSLALPTHLTDGWQPEEMPVLGTAFSHWSEYFPPCEKWDFLLFST